jgi:hypothetical protein
MTDADIERLLREDFERTTRDAKLPSAGLVYWRAGIRARSEAARTADRPLTIAHGVAAAAVAGVAAALGGAAWHSLPPLTDWGRFTALAVGAAALAVISPLALVAVAARMRVDRPQD